VNRREVLAGGATLAAGAAVKAIPALGETGTQTAATAHVMPLMTRKIPSSGAALPVIGLGTSGPFEVGESEAARAPLREVLSAFFGGGATLIDTSPMYSTAEGVLGDLLTAEMQREAFIATKVWTSGEAAGIEQMRRSMMRMKRTMLDLVQVHNLLDLATQLKTLRRWKEEGRVRYIGITHYTVAAHEDLARVIEREKVDFAQFNYSVMTRDAEQRLLPLCAARGVAVIINRAFEDGRLFERVRGKPLPEFAQEFDCTSWAQLFLKYVLANPAVTCVIPATGKPHNELDNLAAGRGRLPDDSLRRRILASVA
jgi:aryl-alcohol dehydrogenase-like predicted oxidoreductase